MIPTYNPLIFENFDIPLYSKMRFFFLAIVLYSGSAQAQIFLNELGNVFGDLPYYNQEFIMNNRIKSIRGKYLTKAELDYIYPSSDFVYYEFNRSGQLIYERRCKYLDTTDLHYEYHNNSMLAKAFKRDKYCYHVYTYDYDINRRLLRSRYYQQRTDRSNAEPYDSVKAKLITEQTFDYMELSEIMYKKIYLNSSGEGYKDEFFHMDEDQKLLRQESKLKVGSGITEVDYQYDEMGRLTEKLSKVKFITEKTKKFEYTYDDQGNLEVIMEYRNNFHLTEYQIVYKADATLKAIIKRNVPSNFMTILKFTEYIYHPRL
jgi:hypothetical protein